MGTSLFDKELSNDVARDGTAALDEGLSVPETTQHVLPLCADWLGDEEDGPLVFLALAALHRSYGAIQPELRDQTLGLLMTGAGMEIWKKAGPSGQLAICSRKLTYPLFFVRLIGKRNDA
jgi:hypothetical protein